MKKWIKPTLYLALVCLGLSSSGIYAGTDQAAAHALGDIQPLRFIYLVRHAEKQTGKNPELTAQGHRRATNYAEFFSKLPIDTLYASHFKRNQQTVAPIAKQLKLKVLAFDPHQQKKFAQQLKAETGNVLIVAHNNLTEIIAALGGKVDSKIDHEDYRRVYQLILQGDKVLSTLRYQAY